MGNLPPRNVVIVVGTRPEAIKMKPVYDAFRRLPDWKPILVSTGQHRELLSEALRSLELRPDVELDVMIDDQQPAQVAERILGGLPAVFDQMLPAAVLVQGDTTTAFAAAYASYLHRIPLGHVEAGLRTYDHDHSFPEEGNRQLIARLARWSFAPTVQAAEHLAGEHVPRSSIIVTGNTAIDALLWVFSRRRIEATQEHLLVTMHRRESFGEPLRQVVSAIVDFLDARPAARVVWPVHPNPAVRSFVEHRLGTNTRVRLLPPQPYEEFVQLLAAARLILSDSGGVQEEAPSLGKTVLVAREHTERPEALAAGTNRLVGRDRARILSALLECWDAPPFTGALPAASPFGDGRAAARIVEVLTRDLQGNPG